MRRARSIVVLLALPGCLSTHGYGSARLLTAGQSEHQVAVDVYAPEQSPGSDGPEITGLQPRYTYRRGIARGLELDVAAWPLGTSVAAKVPLASTASVAVAVAPEISFGVISEPGLLGMARLPVMAEFELARWLALRPALGLAVGVRPEHEHAAALVGGSIGIALRPTARVTFEPAVAMLVDPEIGLRYFGGGLAFTVRSGP